MVVKKFEGDYLESNTFLVEKNNEILIIDCGANLSKIKEFTKNKKVLGIFLTHAHFDHSCYCEEYAKAFNTKIFMSNRGKEIISDGEKNYGEKFAITSFENFFTLQNDGELKLGNFEIKYFSTPGHSPCAMCFLIENHLFSGDTLFENSIGRIDLYGSDKQEMIASLKKLDNLNFEVCYSGHGNESSYDRQKRNIKTFIRFLSR